MKGAALFSLACALTLPISAWAGNPWEELMGPGKPRIWTEPQGRFSIDLPVGWTAVKNGSDNIVQFTKSNTNYRQSAYVSVEMRTLPPGVKLSHFALHAEKELKKNARNYRKHSTKVIPVVGRSARQTHFTYQERGSIQRTNEGLRVILVSGERGWIITLLTVAGAQKLFAEDFSKMIKGFNPGASGTRVKSPKKLKKLRAGEMVNPDLLKY